MRRTLTAVVVGALALAPAGAALAQEAPAEPEVETTAEEPSVLERWLDAITRLVSEATAEDPAPEEGDGTDGEGTDSEAPAEPEGDTALDVLLDELLRGIEIQLMIDQAMAEVEDGSDADGDGTEEGEEETGEDVEGEDVEGEELEGDEAEANHGQLVSTVAQCAPRGRDAKGFLEGAKNHGAYVSAVARGATITLDVPNVVEADNELGLAIDGSEAVELTVETLEDAEALCAALATIAEARALEAQLAELDGEEDEKALAKAEREEAKEQRRADRDAAKAERDEAKAQRAADRAAAKAERDADRAGAKAARGQGKKHDR